MQARSQIPNELYSPSREFNEASERIGLYWWYWDHKTKSMTMSPALIKVLGYSPEEFNPSSPSIYKNIHPDDVEENLKRIRKLIYGEVDRYEIDYRVRNSEGGWSWFYNRGVVIESDKDGKALLIGGISMDMSGQYTHMLTKVQEKDKFEFIFRHSHEAIVIFELKDDQVGRVLDANEAARKLLSGGGDDSGLPDPTKAVRDQMLGKKGALSQAVLEKGYARIEQKVILKDGRKAWLDISAHAFTLTGEKFMIALVSDKTPVKSTEAALRESERLHRTLLEAADDRISLVTVSGKPVLYNKSFYESLGYTEEEFFKLNPVELIHPDDREEQARVAQSTIKEGSGSFDYRAKHKDGHYLHMSTKISVIKGDEDEEDLALFLTRDMTRFKMAMRELELAKTQAEESDQLKSAFLANMSHEIRTPMNSIVGFSNLLANPDLEEETRSIYVQRIIRNSELLLTLISDIIDLAKIESGQLSIIFGKQRLSELISEMEVYALEELERVNKDQVKITTHTENGDCIIETDLIRVTQIIKNLINNAIKFTQEGSIRLGCSVSKDRKRVTVFVEDTGIGIAREHFDVIFDQFRQVDGSNTRKFGGTGLGLAICRNLIEMMDGRIWVESEKGKGSRFQFELPRKAHGKVIREVTSSRGLELVDENLDTESGQLSIMVVDDQPDTLEMFRYLLSELGHSVKLASNGYDALRPMELGQRPDVVLMDIQMPVLSGLDTMRLIKQRYPEIRVVAQSAHALAGDRERFIEEGFDAYLPKPFTEEQLSTLLSSLFRE